jgi:signal transduction histidine kinase
VTGCVFDELNQDGVLVDSIVELEDQSSVEVLSTVYWWRIGAAALALAVAVLLLVVVVGLMKLRRRMIAERAVAVERQRMAADLHDTIEQHLAGVKILLTCALKPQGVPEETKKVLEQAAAMLIHAKGEVRSTIMNLRGADDGKSLEDHFREMASSLRHGGVTARVLLRGVPVRMDAARLGDLLLIVREAVTNAVKHGKAKTVVIVSDPMPEAGGFVLKVLNDGVPFDAASALGPETGHFGLAGMKERASRSGFALDFLVYGKWTVVKVEVPK